MTCPPGRSCAPRPCAPRRCSQALGRMRREGIMMSALPAAQSAFAAALTTADAPMPDGLMAWTGAPPVRRFESIATMCGPASPPRSPPHFRPWSASSAPSFSQLWRRLCGRPIRRARQCCSVMARTLPISSRASSQRRPCLSRGRRPARNAASPGLSRGGCAAAGTRWPLGGAAGGHGRPHLHGAPRSRRARSPFPVHTIWP